MTVQPHLKLENVNRVCFISGNPDRIPVIGENLKDSEVTGDHRGLVSYQGFTPRNGIPVSVLTTGMGGPTTAIVLEEAYRAGGRVFIRIGSCGSLMAGETHGIGALYLPFGAIRAEGVSSQLIPQEVPALATPRLYQQMQESASQLGIPVNLGLVVSSDLFYPPSGDNHTKWATFGGTCIEMESAVLFSYGIVKQGLQVATILTSDGNLVTGKDIYNGNEDRIMSEFNAGVKKSIEITVNMIDNYYK